MSAWDVPPRAKVFEALGALADGRVRLLDGRTAEVLSSSRDRTYRVTWSEDGRAIGSNDNASIWRGYAGYPILAVLMARGLLDYDPRVASLLAGVPWKQLNGRFRNRYDDAVASVLRGLEADGVDTAPIGREVDRILSRFAELDLQRLGGRRIRPAD
ncbi:MAG: hypothetical protein KBD01_05285 [Acidobacteria bacterium]|nr:hypothetical protein [Acidobacteriota bacterium]